MLRNDDIRRQAQNHKCDVLRNQIAGQPYAEYQLRKAGCL
jgi:hypothetical protein